MLMIYMNPVTWDALPERERREIFAGHERFIAMVTESGEMIRAEALADPSTGAAVRVRQGAVHATDGPYTVAEEHFCGYYLVECPDRERAVELAALIPDARYTGVEVRPMMDGAAPDL
ncbi:YciI family protein [Sphaerisporangium sp. NPDC004334]